ncbi:DUF4190 domain-containing protein [Companilactobacillus ginsenosidimutans]|uniref:Uncharacterized protein n=1 Tax=Companilactobacillus ginsenosidimutans TaxID=1007676 RepID=A0A0H4QEI5_9LACO|nr:DUF4190 domain-containing protein [Companilactobacillus ginsenosidimutans]AKP66794.1 hypothetical protein ABM34_03905 [Companilactobacillus ginsenosidimutans]
MDLLLAISSFVLIISILTIIGFFITWIVGVIIKRKGPKTTGKIGMSITTVFLITSFAGSAVGTYHLVQQEAVKEQITKTQDKRFKTASKEFKNKFLIVGSNLETIGTNEYKAWGDKIDNSDEDFDVDVAVTDIVTDNSTSIEQSDKDIKNLEKKLKIMSDNDTGKYNLKKYKTAYKRIGKFHDFVSYPTGSYNSFSDTMTTLDDNVTDSYNLIK